jgi:tetratricopeptide (TPR) repeat protein
MRHLFKKPKLSSLREAEDQQPVEVARHCSYQIHRLPLSLRLPIRQAALVGLSLALCFAGWINIRDYAWIPSDAPRWNPFALKESGFGRTLARILTEQANTSYHHGLFEQSPPNFANPFSQWLDAGTNSLGFQGRLKYRPVEKYPLHPYEVKQALEQAEKNLRLAFELDPGNYASYDVYLFFLTTQVTQTEFASMNGTQLKDDDDDEQADAGKGIQAQRQPNRRSVEGRPNDAGAHGDVGKDNHQSQQLTNAIQQWEGQERERRHTRAIEITEEAIRKFRPNTEDPERFLTAAVMWYNRFLLLAPEVADRLKSEEARKKFDEVGRPTLDKMKYYIQLARARQHDLEQKGLWQAIPERRKEFLQVARLMEKSTFTLAVALQNNRSRMNQDQSGSTVWAPPEQE